MPLFLFISNSTRSWQTICSGSCYISIWFRYAGKIFDTHRGENTPIILMIYIFSYLSCSLDKTESNEFDFDGNERKKKNKPHNERVTKTTKNDGWLWWHFISVVLLLIFGWKKKTDWLILIDTNYRMTMFDVGLSLKLTANDFFLSCSCCFGMFYVAWWEWKLKQIKSNTEK